MRESYKEDFANHFGLEVYADGGKVMGVSTTEVHAGKLWSSEINQPECRYCLCCWKAKRSIALLASDGMARAMEELCGIETLSKRRNFKRENRDIPEISRLF